MKYRRAISDGYLPAAADDYDSLSGYETEGRGLAGYDRGAESQAEYQEEYEGGSGSGEEARQAEEEYSVPTTVAPESREAEDSYGAPGQAGYEDGSGSGSGDYSYDEETAETRQVEGEYAAPPGYTEDGAARAVNDGYEVPSNNIDDGYAAPDSGYSATGQNGFPFEIVEGRGAAGAGAGAGAGEVQCPGGTIDACVAVCPGSSARVYGACVQGCADRCPEPTDA